ncbi:cytochrome P450 [Burkholderia gladioli]|uniref:cytochrome P450 n=1 Tax=Burkholderia gladioli TaxID=28095 RepID=UPI0016411120|nr:cytochrome P450 [Burkholderia gladioli]
MKLTDLSTREFLHDPYPLYESLRAEGRLVRLGPNAMISGHYEVVEALLHDRRFGKRYFESVRLRYGEDAPGMKLFQSIERMFLAQNPPIHTRLRALVTKAFNARQIEGMRDIAHRVANRLVDSIESAGTADLIGQFAFPLPIYIIGQMLDIPVEDATRLGAEVDVLVKIFDAAPLNEVELMRTVAAYDELERYFLEVIEVRRTRPGEDLVSMLITVEEGGETLSQDEIVSNVVLLFLAGHETTSSTIGNSLIALHRHPEQLALLKHDPSHMPKAVLECVRYDGAVQNTVRAPLEDLKIEGTDVPAGTSIFLMLGSANRDPAKFSNPDHLEIGRDSMKALTFGAGIHHCLGYRLALMEIETALSVLLERLPNLQLTGLDRLTWNQRGNLRGVTSLSASW